MQNKLLNAIKHYFSNLILIWLAILLYRSNSYYVNFLRPEAQATLLYLALTYTIFAFPLHFIFYQNKSKGYIFLSMLGRVFRDYSQYIGKFVSEPGHSLPKIEKHEKVTILFLIVKIYFLPIMLNFFFSNFTGIQRYLPAITGLEFLSKEGFLFILFPFSLSLIFMIDTLYFSFGYAVEAGFLKNKVKSVEPTAFGWAVALASYPPLNGVFTYYALWYPNDYVNFGSEMGTIIARVLIILFLGTYLLATLALGAKCSNLTNRGIVSRGPYAIIRHPAYICKNMAWWLTLIPIMSLTVFFSMLAWSLIYFFRAITEERHLIKDPDYVEYCKKVRYRFIPWVW